MKLQNMFEWFQETREWRKLKPNSRKVYHQMMRHALNKFPIMDKVHRITPKVVDEWYDELIAEGKKHRAVTIMKIMRRIWNVAKRAGHVKTNPFEKMNLDGLEARNTIWTRNQVDAVIHTLNKKGYEDTAMLIKMCYDLAQRPGDIINMNRSNLNDDQTVTIQQEKTGAIVTIPVSDDLWADMMVAGNFFITETSLRIHNKHFAEVRKELDLEHLQIRDLRRTALTEIMESGATDAEGQAISGHKNRDMLSVYAPPTVKMAQSAMKKRYFVFNDL